MDGTLKHWTAYGTLKCREYYLGPLIDAYNWRRMVLKDILKNCGGFTLRWDCPDPKFVAFLYFICGQYIKNGPIDARGVDFFERFDIQYLLSPAEIETMQEICCRY
jgi:hypothetical protein